MMLRPKDVDELRREQAAALRRIIDGERPGVHPAAIAWGTAAILTVVVVLLLGWFFTR